MPTARPTHDPQFLDPDHEAIVRFGETYFDDDEERESFIDTLMERRGYARQSGWALPQQPPAPPKQQQPQKPSYFKR